MPDQSMIPPPGVSPQEYANYLRQQQLANVLFQSSVTPVQQPETGSVRGLYQQPRTGAISALSKVAEALMGRKVMDQNANTQGKLLAQTLSQFGEPSIEQQPGQPVAPPASPDTQSVQPSSGTTQPSYRYNPGGPLGIPGTDSYNAARLYMEKPEEYAKLRMGPPDWQTAMRYSNGDPELAAQFMRAEAAKKGTIEARGGNFIQGPGQPAMITPDVSHGEQYVRNADGTFSAQPIGGSAEVQAERARQENIAKQTSTPTATPNQFNPGGPPLYTYPPLPGGGQGPVHQGMPPQVPPQTAPTSAGAAAAPVAPRAPIFPPRAGNTAADLEQQKKGTESGQAYSDTLIKNAENATEVRRSLAELRSLAGTAGVSASNPAKLQLGSALIAAGADPQWVSRGLHTDIGALTAATKQTGSLALDSIHSMTSRGTNFDLQTFMRYNPNLDMSTPEGFKRVTDFMDKRMQQEVAKQADFDQWSQKQPPNRWASGHAAHWLSKENERISSGETNSAASKYTATKQMGKQTYYKIGNTWFDNPDGK